LSGTRGRKGDDDDDEEEEEDDDGDGDGDVDDGCDSDYGLYDVTGMI